MLRRQYLAKAIWPLILLVALSGCADRPTYISIKKAMEALERQESLPQIIEVINMHKLESFERDGEFVVEVYFEQNFLLGYREAAKLTQSTISERHPDSRIVLSENQKPSTETIESILAKKYGHFKQADLRHRYSELVFHKSDGKWLFLERRKHWKDFNPSFFPQR